LLFLSSSSVILGLDPRMTEERACPKKNKKFFLQDQRFALKIRGKRAPERTKHENAKGRGCPRPF